MALKLDFTGLNKLALHEAQKDFTDAPEAPETALEEPLRGKPIEIALEALKGLKKSQEAPQKQRVEQKALISLTREKEDRQRTLEAYRDYQNNIKKAGSLRTDILKGVQTGEPAQTLLLKAVECISCMTGDRLFYTQIAEDLKAVYGEAFLEEIPLEWELEEVEERLEKMKEALARETTEPDAKDRIKRAIRKHEEKRTQLKELLERSKTGRLTREYREKGLGA